MEIYFAYISAGMLPHFGVFSRVLLLTYKEHFRKGIFWYDQIWKKKKGWLESTAMADSPQAGSGGGGNRQ